MNIGYDSGLSPVSFNLSVPWGTDLSIVTITLTDLFTPSGLNADVDES
jgi:hypothetical protein